LRTNLNLNRGAAVGGNDSAEGFGIAAAGNAS